jgi:hypothetical protein
MWIRAEVFARVSWLSMSAHILTELAECLRVALRAGAAKYASQGNVYRKRRIGNSII